MDAAETSEVIVGQAEVLEADAADAITKLGATKRAWLVPSLVTGVALLAVVLILPLTWQVALTIGLPLAFMVLRPIYVTRAARRLWIKQVLASVGGRIAFRFDDYGCVAESSLRQHRLAWAALSRAVETPAAFLVYTMTRNMFIVPKRAFADAEVVKLGRVLRERITLTPPRKPPILNTASNRTLLKWLLPFAAYLWLWRFIGGLPPPQPSGHGQIASARRLPMPNRAGKASDVDSSP